MRAGTVLSFAALAALSVACSGAENSQQPLPARIEVKAAVAPLEETTVYAPVEGVVAEIRVTDGSPVRTGDPLVSLSNTALDRDLTYSRTALASLEARARAHDQSSAAATVSAGEREAAALGRVQEAERRRDRFRTLLASGDVTRSDLALADAELAAATRDLEAARATRDARPGSAREQLQAEIDRARADLRVAEERKAQLVVRSPATGTIRLAEIRPGAAVFARDALASVVDHSSTRVEARIAPELLRFVKSGQLVDVTVMTIPPRTARVPLTSVLAAGPNGGSIISATIPNADRSLQPGTPATITIQ